MGLTIYEMFRFQKPFGNTYLFDRNIEPIDEFSDISDVVLYGYLFINKIDKIYYFLILLI